MPMYFERYGTAVEPKDGLKTILAFAEDLLGPSGCDAGHTSAERLKILMLSRETVKFQISQAAYDLGWVVDEAARSPDRVLVVDVGGSGGHALKRIFAHTPELPRHRCVLEDEHEVVEVVRQSNDADLAGVRKIGTHLSREQPTPGKQAEARGLAPARQSPLVTGPGALVYYMRRFLHNYSDK